MDVMYRNWNCGWNEQIHLVSGLQLYILKVLKLSQEYDKLSEGLESGKQLTINKNVKLMRMLIVLLSEY